ncbi:zinc finger CCHC domain-containing protein 14 isoform X1, partial [Tachysurus ichikawai]
TVPREAMTGLVDDSVGSEVMSPNPAPTCQELPIKMHAGKPGKGEHGSAAQLGSKAGEKSGGWNTKEHGKSFRNVSHATVFSQA